MRVYSVIRIVGVAVIVLTLFVGVLAPVAGQEVTEEATQEAFTSEMMTMEGACPQGEAAVHLDEMMMQMEATAEATEDMGGMEATEEMPGMEMTEEATTEPMMGPMCLFGTFSGAAEVPGPGDEDALGVAFVTLDSSTGEVCYEIAVANITLPADAMHIHAAPAGESGDVVVPFPTAPDAEGMAMGCTTATDLALVSDIAMNPAGYYVNVHTTDFPDGAARAQLALWDDMMMDQDM